MFPRIRIPSPVTSLPIPMLRRSPNFLILALVLSTFTGGIIYSIFQSSNWPWYYHFCPTPPPNYLAASSHLETICAPGARYLNPRALIDSVPTTSAGSRRSGGIERGISEGVPKIIHQSWMDGNLPVKFSKWSDSLRVKHPDWSWVLWTDDDNAHLISERHPHLNESYWALKNAIQRADFVRNIYMWDFGGVYADLDMECLRPLDSLFSLPIHSSTLSPSYPISPISHSTHAIAFVGSMETLPTEQHHSIPNAFLASTPHHPFWLLPLSRILIHLHADKNGKGVQSDQLLAAEAMTGPEALLRSVEGYRSHKYSEVDISVSILEGRIHPSLESMLKKSEKEHEVVVFDPGVIYPFSWSTTEEAGLIHQSCRAAPGYPFDPIKCQDACRAYERGARLITYWSHTWSQTGDEKDLGVVGT